MIPIPPIHWENCLHIRSEWFRLSTSVRTVAPVVVRPDMDSK
jgi:hypothetical protein